MRSRGRALKLAALVAGGSLLLVVAGHAGPLRPFLTRFGGGAAAMCPVARLDPRAIEAQRAKASQVLVGAASARRRFAGPFTIMMTTRNEVVAWATAAGVTCNDEFAKTSLRCTDVPARALDPATSSTAAAKDVFVRFDPGGMLVGLDVMRTVPTPSAAASLAGDLVRSLEREAGPRAVAYGPLDATALAAPGMRMASVEFRFSDYAADVSVSRLSDGQELLVREQYRAASPRAP